MRESTVLAATGIVADDLSKAILNSIQSHDARWSWYQLFQALIVPNPMLGPLLMPTLRNLEQEELIESITDTSRPCITRYRLTSSGREYLRGRHP